MLRLAERKLRQTLTLEVLGEVSRARLPSADPLRPLSRNLNPFRGHTEKSFVFRHAVPCTRLPYVFADFDFGV
jgi:hypothetical protein